MKSKKIIDIKNCFVSSILLCLLTSSANAQNTGALLAEILQSNNSLLNGNLPIEQRISTYASIQIQIDEIITQYPGSSESIAFLSNQAIGNFNVQEFRNSYITELTDFYNVTCESSPSLQCLGFVALNLGIETCSAADSFESINLGQGQITNAIKIFNTDESSKSYVSLATNAFRNCVLESRLSNAELLQDYFAQNLVSLYLDIGDEAQATATIQRIVNPYLTFLSVIELTEYQGGIDREFIDRMRTYQESNNFLGAYSQQIATIRLNSLILDYEIVGSYFSGVEAPPLGRDANTEDILYRLEYLEELIAFIDKFIERKEAENMAAPNDRYYYELNVNGMRSLGLNTRAQITVAEDDDPILKVVGGYLALRVTSKDIAADFYLQSKLSGFEMEFMQELLFEISGRDQFLDYSLRFPVTGRADDALLWEENWNFPFDDFREWKVSIREEYYCEGITTLFSDLKGEVHFPEAVDYLSSKLSALDEMPICGDSSLELLLQ